MSVFNNLTPDQKYSKDGPFMEPVVRCDSCVKLVLREHINKQGCCPLCGNGRFRNVRAMNEDDMAVAKGWAEQGKIDPDWLKLFEGYSS